jgi:hypothetical protein
MAQYRAGRYAEALKTLVPADRLNAAKLGGGDSVPADLALLARVLHRLGNEDEVGKLMDRLRRRARDGRWNNDEETAVLLREAELSVHGKPPPWPTEKGPQPAPAEPPKR